MKLFQLLCGGAAALLATTPASALDIRFINEDGVAGTAAEAAFEIAARYWESVITNDATVTIGVSYYSFGRNAIGSTWYVTMEQDVSTWLDATAATRSDSTLDQTLVLPGVNDAGGVSFVATGSSANAANDSEVKIYVEGDRKASQTLDINTSLVKAMGGTATYAADNPDQLDGRIAFNTDVAFDFDPTDGIDEGAGDFIGTAIHELGHALGFVSGVDTVDSSSYPQYEGMDPLPDTSLNDRATYSALDLFRYSRDEAGVAPGDDPVIDVSVGTDAYFSIDGGQTALAGNGMSGGGWHGSGGQASHWQDQPGCTGPLMDSSACENEVLKVTALDLAAFDAMGWNTSVDVLADPGYVATTADIYRQFATAIPEPATWATMLAGLAMVGGALRRRQRGLVQSVGVRGA